MSPRDARAAKVALLIVALVVTFALVSGYVSQQGTAHDQAIEQLSR